MGSLRVFTRVLLVLFIVGAGLFIAPANRAYATSWQVNDWVSIGYQNCWYVSQDSFAYEFALVPVSGGHNNASYPARDVDLYLYSGNSQLASSTRAGTASEYIYFVPMMSYANGLKICARAYEAPGSNYVLTRYR